jgi:hypothetical protein
VITSTTSEVFIRGMMVAHMQERAAHRYRWVRCDNVGLAPMEVRAVREAIWSMPDDATPQEMAREVFRRFNALAGE